MSASLPTGAVDLLFTSDFAIARPDIRLFEVEEEVVEALIAGGSVNLKGAADEEAVLTTPSRTYAVRMLETTNILLMAPTVSWAAGASALQMPIAAQATLEVVRTAPRTSSLRTLLALRPYTGQLADSKRGSEELFTFNDLVSRVQASEAEIKAALTSLSATQVSGHWRLVDALAAIEVLRIILATVASNGWPLSRIPDAELRNALTAECDAHLTRHVLSTHGVLATTNVGGCTSDTWSLSQSAVRVHVVTSLGVYLIASSNRKQRLVEFMDRWRQLSEDYSTRPSLDMLRSTAVSDGFGTEVMVWYMPITSLPSTLRERLTALFSAKLKWTVEEIKPYVVDFLEPSIPIEAFLAKHTRSISSTTGTKLYTAKDS